MKLSFNMEDVGQVCVGAFALAVPISFSEEAWHLAQTLPNANLCFIIFLSMCFLAVFAHQSVFQRNIRKRIPVFIFRIVIAYVIASVVVALVLISLDKLPLYQDPLLSLKRIIVITMPASMGAIVVDSFDKE
ncbi:DUF2391 family protein [Vibrio viridaestus]|uniref:DUF2391 family protein n=1 Tax=Vibrio viridaestus TaxID=2487322 RepID=A0A3N9TLL1_9VIBR|nr:DUF2391 family protein [Vibrio viridaestus]RQW64884.1 DUF2391 family protein [Vibrio viridaestus]